MTQENEAQPKKKMFPVNCLPVLRIIRQDGAQTGPREVKLKIMERLQFDAENLPEDFSEERMLRAKYSSMKKKFLTSGQL